VHRKLRRRKRRRRRLLKRTIRLQRRFLLKRIRLLTRNHYRFRRRLFKRKIMRRIRRRIKRRRKRRRKYFGKWIRRYNLSIQRRRRLSLRQKRRSFPPLNRMYLRHRRRPINKHQFSLYAHAFSEPLQALGAFQNTWAHRTIHEYRNLISVKLFQQKLRTRQVSWNERELPKHKRLRFFARRRRLGGFGIWKRWLAALFVKGQRLQHYKEREFPIVLHLIRRSSTLDVPNWLRPVKSAGFRTQRAKIIRNRFFRKLRFIFFFVNGEIAGSRQ